MSGLELLGGPVPLVCGGVAHGAREVALIASAVTIVGNTVPCLAQPIAQFQLVVAPCAGPIPMLGDAIAPVGDVVSIGSRRVPFLPRSIAVVLGTAHRVLASGLSSASPDPAG